MGHRDETMIAQTLSNVARPRVVARARATQKSTAARAQFGAVKGFDPLRVSPKARGNFQVVASVTKKPDLSDPVLRAKLAKGMGHNYYGEPAWPNDLLYIFPVVILGTIALCIGLAVMEPTMLGEPADPFATPVFLIGTFYAIWMGIGATMPIDKAITL